MQLAAFLGYVKGIEKTAIVAKIEFDTGSTGGCKLLARLAGHVRISLFVAAERNADTLELMSFLCRGINRQPSDLTCQEVFRCSAVIVAAGVLAA